MSDEPGEASDTATPEECEIASPEGSPDAGDEFHPFDEVYDAYQPGPAKRTIGADGLAETLDTTSESDIPALSTESLVCMGDYSRFVSRDSWGRILAEFEPSEVRRMPNGRWSVAAALLKERSQGELGGYARESELMSVEPVRPQCRHYVRQKGTFHLNAAHKKYYRLCAARRTTEGTFMTVSDSGMYACDMREPYDVASAALIDDFDQLKIAQGAKREHLPIFQTNGIFDDAQKRKET